nr:unnamed protein product [Callosobruchus chinensis]
MNIEANGNAHANMVNVNALEINTLAVHSPLLPQR